MVRFRTALAVLIIATLANEVSAQGKLGISHSYQKSAKKGGYVDFQGAVANLGTLTITKIEVSLWKPNGEPEAMQEIKTWTEKGQFPADENGKAAIGQLKSKYTGATNLEAYVEITFYNGMNHFKIRSKTATGIESSGS